MKRLATAVLIAGAVLTTSVSTASAATLYESATLGTLNPASGVGISEDQYLGSRFTLTERALVTAIGGHVKGAGFAAIIPLSSASALPSFLSSELEANAIVGAAFSLPANTSEDLRLSVSVLLEPGAYALLFGAQGPFGSDPSISGSMPQNNPQLPAASYFYLSRVDGPWIDGGFQDARFVVEGEFSPVPLPAALPLLMSALGFFGFIGWRKKQLVA